MITGFNTDVEHDGVIYHVQTEDKGLDTPLILSLVYVGGAILASKRSPYDDLITKGFDERELSERLNRQHKLICAAIRAGRIEDLKRMSQREPQAAVSTAQMPAVTPPKPAEPTPKTLTPPVKPEPINQPLVIETTAEYYASLQTKEAVVEKPEQPSAPAKTTPPKLPLSPPNLKVKKAPQPSKEKGVKQTMRAILNDVVSDFQRAEAASVAKGLHLSLVDEREFRGGEMVTIRIRVGAGTDGKEVIGGADVTVKILGSTFRPLIFPTRTASDGIATVRASLPHFQTGRAAILIRATARGFEAELRRIIHQG